MAGPACRAHLLALVTASGSASPIATTDRLLREWPTLSQVVAAPAHRLFAVAAGDRAAVAAVRGFRAAMRHVLRGRIAARPMLSDWRALLDYLRLDMAHQLVERFRVLHLDTRNRLIRDELMWTGSIDEAPVHVREIMHRAMDLGSASLILVHNHPSGDPAPSRADIRVTRSIIDAGRTLGIAVQDHLVIGTRGHVSLRSKGLI